MDIIRPQLDQVRIEKDGKLPFTLIDAINRIYGYLAQSLNTSSSNLVVIQDTHANRNILYPAVNETVGSFYFETDRKVEYVVSSVSSANAWVYFAGTMSGLIAARPADLGTNDAGFLFTSTDSLDYRWSGTAWVTLGTVRGGANLTNVGKLTKVSAAGTITEAAVTDDATANVYTTARNLLAGETAVVSSAAGRVYLGAKGSAGAGALELSQTATDADNLLVGLIQAGDTNQSGGGGEKRVAVIQFLTQGATANDRGGQIKFITKANGGAIVVQEILTNAGFHGFGGTAVPAYAVDATGDVNASGVHRTGGVAGITGVAALAKLTIAGTNGTLTFTGGIITAYTAPT